MHRVYAPLREGKSGGAANRCENKALREKLAG
jgi:hypothetical protein